MRRKLIENRIKYLNKKEEELTDRNLLHGFKISGLHYGFSHFNPLVIKKFIEEYNIKSIFDATGGWGHRLLGAMDIDYIYNDIDERTVEGCKEIFKIFDFPNKNKVFYNEDASTFTPKEEYEAVFTCPPYYDLELYNHEKTSTNMYTEYNEWLNKWWYGVVKSSLKSSVKYFAFVMNDRYSEDMLNICIKNGLKLIKEIVLFNRKSHFGSRTEEKLIILGKTPLI